MNNKDKKEFGLFYFFSWVWDFIVYLFSFFIYDPSDSIDPFHEKEISDDFKDFSSIGDGNCLYNSIILALIFHLSKIANEEMEEILVNDDWIDLLCVFYDSCFSDENNSVEDGKLEKAKYVFAYFNGKDINNMELNSFQKKIAFPFRQYLVHLYSTFIMKSVEEVDSDSVEERELFYFIDSLTPYLREDKTEHHHLKDVCTVFFIDKECAESIFQEFHELVTSKNIDKTNENEYESFLRKYAFDKIFKGKNSLFKNVIKNEGINYRYANASLFVSLLRQKFNITMTQVDSKNVKLNKNDGHGSLFSFWICYQASSRHYYPFVRTSDPRYHSIEGFRL